MVLMSQSSIVERREIMEGWRGEPPDRRFTVTRRRWTRRSRYRTLISFFLGGSLRHQGLERRPPGL